MLICVKCPIRRHCHLVSLQYQSNSAASRASLPCFPSPIAARTGTNFIRLMANYGDEARWGGLPFQPFQRLPVPPTPPRAPFPGDICGLSPLAGPVSGLWLVHEEALAQAGGAAWFRPRNRFFFPFLSFFLAFAFSLLFLAVVRRLVVVLLQFLPLVIRPSNLRYSSLFTPFFFPPHSNYSLPGQPVALF